MPIARARAIMRLAPGNDVLRWKTEFRRGSIDKSRQIGPGKISGLIASLQTGKKVVVSVVSGKKVEGGKVGSFLLSNCAGSVQVGRPTPLFGSFPKKTRVNRISCKEFHAGFPPVSNPCTSAGWSDRARRDIAAGNRRTDRRGRGNSSTRITPVSSTILARPAVGSSRIPGAGLGFSGGFSSRTVALDRARLRCHG